MRPWVAIAVDADDGNACASDRMGQHPFRHYRQSRLGEQLYQGGLSVVPTALSLGLAEYVVLAKIDQLQRSRKKDQHADIAMISAFEAASTPA